MINDNISRSLDILSILLYGRISVQRGNLIVLVSKSKDILIQMSCPVHPE